MEFASAQQLCWVISLRIHCNLVKEYVAPTRTILFFSDIAVGLLVVLIFIAGIKILMGFCWCLMRAGRWSKLSYT